MRALLALIVLIGILFIVVPIGFFVAVPSCTKNCDSRPATFYGVPFPYVSYSSMYHTTNSGVSIEDDPSSGGVHSSSSSEEESHPVEEEPHFSVSEP